MRRLIDRLGFKSSNSARRVWQRSDCISRVPGESALFDRLETDEFISSPNGRWHFVLQSDGHLCMYESWIWTPGNCRWASGTCKPGPFQCKLVIQGNGNMVLTERDKYTTWSTNTNGTRAARMSIHNDGQVKLTDESGETTYWSIRPNRVLFGGPYHGFQHSIQTLVVPYFQRALDTMRKLQTDIFACKTPHELTTALETLLPVIGLFLTMAKDKTCWLFTEIDHQIEAGSNAPGVLQDVHYRSSWQGWPCPNVPLMRIKGVNSDLAAMSVARPWIVAQMDPTRVNVDLDRVISRVLRHRLDGYVTFAPMVRALDAILRHLVAAELVPNDEGEKLLKEVHAMKVGAEECSSWASRLGIII
ncbi:hypothetical protein AMAG_12309 [Allomyces macrogynus ATCC 38327]|uniref:Bulb-type lectin domain-containing protein n=1 Tax=Allomyces macrogynus (strain ATCC 38327) TaxID=578462 RepID=A0A0L0SXK1_ALLM3|nr:hypothetical protein AMAG_12309 [Allomyces macrogynus ATCC 38327]|eukprot:KNE67237.1 hypothetical protein AMAG_12309 [Allomyces macrogynus ATCC 38327]